MNANILIVDGRIDLMEPLKEIFERKGYDVSMVEDEAKAISLLKRRNFNLLLAPRQLPGKSKAWDVKAMKRLCPSMAIVMVNSAGEKKEMSEIIASGIEAVVDKPFNVQKLVDTIEFVLEAPCALVVDRKAQDLESLRDMLTKRRCRALATMSVDKAMEMIQENNFDIVFLDVGVVETSGIEILQRMKKIRPGMEVVVMIDYSSLSLVGDLLKGGAYTCVYKPFLDIERLVKVFKEVQSQKGIYPTLTGMKSLPSGS